MSFTHSRDATRSPQTTPTQAASPAAGGPAGSQRATFAAGCFWGVEAAFRAIEGVTETSVGYTGGHTPAPTYEQVCTHTTGHAEAVDVWFDPAVVSYGELLDVLWRTHNPTVRSHRGPDLGDQYRSAIFVHSPAQEAEALASRDREQARRDNEIVTEIVPAGAFHRAEERHQRYLERSGRAPRCLAHTRG